MCKLWNFTLTLLCNSVKATGLDESGQRSRKTPLMLMWVWTLSFKLQKSRKMSMKLLRSWRNSFKLLKSRKKLMKLQKSG